MQFRAYEIRPGFSSYQGDGVIGTGSLGNSYSIIVGTQSHKPTTRERERIERSVREAWESLFDPQGWIEDYKRELYTPPYGLAVVYDPSPPAVDAELAEFSQNGFYLIFALLETVDNAGVSEEEERSTHDAIYAAISTQYAKHKRKPRIALVTLYNCSVQVVEGPGPEREEERSRRRNFGGRYGF